MLVNGAVEVYRGRKTLMYDGMLSSLRRFKDDVKVVEEGNECGIGCDGFYDWEEGDRIECFELVSRTLSLEESKADRAVDFDETMVEFEEAFQEAIKAQEASRQGVQSPLSCSTSAVHTQFIRQFCECMQEKYAVLQVFLKKIQIAQMADMRS
eukprot:TRINITY_DN5076_c1_g1_i1.p1 TRINITY_DN5076_c1_g1~~TRINITY_DN5076_c1_g1_i1.p1  ORF type:complete len:176 (-),score=21.09 TRINITY_DN5076_c1_g1_i1:149-607(-)